MRQTATTIHQLRTARLMANVTQAAVAAALGMTREGLSNIERGTTGETVTPEFAERYMAALAALPGKRYRRRAAETAD